MGGRRARSLSEIVGTGLRGQGGFSRALSSADPEAMAASSAKLVSESDRVTDIIYYVSKLADVVRDIVETGRDLSYDERETVARRDWSRIKDNEDLPDDPVITQAVVSAVTKALGRGRR